MFCPNCGAPGQSADAYCKKCGTYLRDVSLRGWLRGGNNPGRAAWSVVISSVVIAALCLCISILILKAESSGDLKYLRYALILCWVIIGHLVTLFLMGLGLWRKMRRARGGFGGSEPAEEYGGGAPPAPERPTERLPGAGSAGEAATELLSPTPRESEGRKQAR